MAYIFLQDLVLKSFRVFTIVVEIEPKEIDLSDIPSLRGTVKSQILWVFSVLFTDLTHIDGKDQDYS
jgi:hypothetical protein